MKIAIVGGGIGGLNTALAMSQAGFAVTVYERAAQLVDQGAGITLAPNATRVLYHLGVGPDLEATSVTPPMTEYRHYRTGRVIFRMMTKDFRELYGAPYMRLHRWDLQHALITRLADTAPGALRLGSCVDRVEPGNGQVQLRFADGRSEIADVVIAADGIRSTIREALFNPAPPVFTGFVAWRGLVDTADLPQHLHESAVAFGQGRHINRYLVRRGELLNFVAVAHRNKWEAEGWTIPAPLDEFLEEFSSFDEGTRTVISRPVLGQVFKWGLFGRPWLEEWSSGRVVLLGDAAHPMLPFLGQGAANAIEDAMILARCLKSEATPEQAFALYQRTRGPRARAATDEAAKRGDRYLGEPDADSLKGNEPGAEYAYDAVSTPLGG
ncbi:MAG: salicylate 1-monooxygenase [Hyphomicrobiales bacterium]|nr:salicylate 1-monooxygenase [Hyphomicrobiales bacterium]